MARDETARERDPERPLLDRRAYLRLVGVAAASVAVAGASESADAAGHDSTSVPADETRPSESSYDDRSDPRTGESQRFDARRETDDRPQDARTSSGDVAGD